MPHQPHNISPLFSAGSNDHGTVPGNLTDLIDLACEFAQNHPGSVALLEALLSKCLDFHEARHPSMTPSIRHLADFLINAMKLSAPNEALSSAVKSNGHVLTYSSTNRSSKTTSSMEMGLQALVDAQDHKSIGDRKAVSSSKLDKSFDDTQENLVAILNQLEQKALSGHGLRGTLGKTTAYLLSPGIAHELSGGLERMSVNENDFKAVCAAVLSLSKRRLNQSSSPFQAVTNMAGQGDSSEFSVKEIHDEILKTSEDLVQPSKMYVAIRLLRTFGFIERPRPNDKRVYVSKWPESWDIWNVDPAKLVDMFWKRHLELNSKPRVDGLSVKVAKNRFLRGKIPADVYVQHMSDYELAARIASFSGKDYVLRYTEDGPIIPLSRDQQVNALSKLIQSDQLAL